MKVGVLQQVDQPWTTRASLQLNLYKMSEESTKSVGEPKGNIVQLVPLIICKHACICFCYEKASVFQSSSVNILAATSAVIVYSLGQLVNNQPAATTPATSTQPSFPSSYSTQL